VIFVGDPRSDIARLIAEHPCGAVVMTGEAARLANIIVSWADDPATTARLGEEARSLFVRRFDRPQAVAAYEESLLKCLRPHGASEAAGASPGRDADGEPDFEC